MAKGATQGAQSAPKAERFKTRSFKRFSEPSKHSIDASALAACDGLNSSVVSREADIDLKDEIALPAPIAYGRFYGTWDDDHGCVRDLEPIPGHEHLFHSSTAETPRPVSVVVLSREEFDALENKNNSRDDGTSVDKGKALITTVRKAIRKKPVTTRAKILKRTRSVARLDVTEPKQTVPASKTESTQFFIGNQTALGEFYDYHLKEMGMMVSKKLAWNWIQVRWPKRSGGYPYLKKIPKTDPPEYEEPRGYNGPVPGWPTGIIYTEPAHLPGPQVRKLLTYLLRAHREFKGTKDWVGTLQKCAQSYVEVGFKLGKDYSSSIDPTFRKLREERVKSSLEACYEMAKKEEDFYAAYNLYSVEDTDHPEMYGWANITWTRMEKIPRPRQQPKRRRCSPSQGLEEDARSTDSEDGSEVDVGHVTLGEPCSSASTTTFQSSLTPPTPPSSCRRYPGMALPISNTTGSIIPSSMGVGATTPAPNPPTLDRQYTWTYAPQITISASAPSLDQSAHEHRMDQLKDARVGYSVSADPFSLQQSPNMIRSQDTFKPQSVDISAGSWAVPHHHQDMPIYMSGFTSEQLGYPDMRSDPTLVSYPAPLQPNDHLFARSSRMATTEPPADSRAWIDMWADTQHSAGHFSPDVIYATSQLPIRSSSPTLPHRLPC
ncbi:uncharacterized protein BDR25DRAFT_119115 [Lindgomyces ingoldianus]|uniref:Uncharacterized protein n=1 Tax=Lindgomyces ingoldianus TaxID=673940 RepID=A0ACB6R457_9PLEO|nr:uncharacterized protein BDR25DRAFT_119115 [Lindgomyces ingoldianus]KAF2474109.1 hypothetical protein BDR25DRAFT_119115 [Lindgomyces ingoldianus]